MHVERSALVPFSAARMFDLVNDVRRYPERFGWCSAAEVLEDSAHEQLARLTLKFAGFSSTLATRNRLQHPHRIDLALAEGPFRSFGGHWSFLDLDDSGSKVGLTLDFEFSSGLLGLALRQGFALLADRLVDDFVQCAYAEGRGA
jgi:ribosome-associated toxin RatA of RatAB toxin-antitoxin module